MEKYPFLTLVEHKILESQKDFKPVPYRKLQPKVSHYLKDMKKCDHNSKLIYPHYCTLHMKNVVMCDTCHAEILPPPIFTHLQSQKVAHDWFL